MDEISKMTKILLPDSAAFFLEIEVMVCKGQWCKTINVTNTFEPLLTTTFHEPYKPLLESSGF